jgi:hypothetical protein
VIPGLEPVSPGSSRATAAEESQAEQRAAEQRERAGLGDRCVRAGEEERVDQPGCIDASRVDVAHPAKVP